jgi:type I restriction enzyme S subunit
MSEWRKMTLGDVLLFQRGFDLTQKSAKPGPYPVISSGGISYTCDTAKVPGPGVVTGRKGVLGKVYYSAGPYWPHDTTLWVKDFKRSDPRFIYYMLQTLPLASLDVGASNPTLNRNHAHLLTVSMPNLTTQRRVSSVLGTLDDLIENNRRRIKLLEQMAQVIYREWFVDFRFPGHENAILRSSSLGPMPEGWEVSQLHELATIVRGRAYRKHELVEAGGALFVNLKCFMRGGGFRRDGLKRYGGQYSPEQQVREGDIVIAVTDLTQAREILVRATLVPRMSETTGVISLDVARIVPNDARDRLALFFALRCTDFPDRVKEFANGSTVLHLAPTHIAGGQVVWPAADLRRRFVELAEPMIGQIDDLNLAVDRLIAIRDLLLPKLVKGQIDVSKLDLDALEEAAG